MSSRSIFQNALRILFLLVAGAEEEEGLEGGARGIFRTEMKLHAFDFWMRYPDYLANELLDHYEETRDIRLIKIVEDIFENEEPDLRRLPMVRYRFGAYERLDDVLGVLISRSLIAVTGRKSGLQVLETDFLIMPRAFEVTDEIVNEYPDLSWYSKRAQVIVELAAGRGGSALKDRQYETMKYAETRLGGLIPSLANEVRIRMKSIEDLGKVSA